jgi:hypothetical protein
MNNFEKIKNMNKEEMVKFLDNLIDVPFDKVEPMKWFHEKYCTVCPDIEVKYNDKTELWKECYFEGKCLYQDSIKDMVKLWLEGE